jgi:hypothetical protein
MQLIRLCFQPGKNPGNSGHVEEKIEQDVRDWLTKNG